jgi:alpha-L-rhamnosidase
MNKWCFIFLLLSLHTDLIGGDLEVVNLKVEYAATPLGMDVQQPRFSWQITSPSSYRGCKQRAYQIVVTNEKYETVWNSGRTVSDQSLNIYYDGAALTASTRYYWSVDVWDQKNKKYNSKSWFETGLMNTDPNLSGWSGAKWIGGGDHDLVLYSQYLPVFRLECSIQLDEKSGSTRAGIIYGANDIRLLDRNKNIYNIESRKNESYILVELDITPVMEAQPALLKFFRVGYHAHDQNDVPIKSIPVPTSIINNNNKYAPHSINLAINMGWTRVHVDGWNEGNLIADFAINPLGGGGDFIAFPVVADIGFHVPSDQIASFTDFQISNYRSPSNILAKATPTAENPAGIFTSDKVAVDGAFYKVNGNKSGVFITADPSINSAPMLRTSFTTSKKKIVKARLYVTARGIYDFYINGSLVTNDHFNPGLTQYTKTHFYQTFDVTKLMSQGVNAMGAIMAEGWWSGGATYMGHFWNFFGDRQSLLAKLVITYNGGETEAIVTHPATWKYFNNGPVIYGSFFQGEVYDASKEYLVKDWSTAAYNDSRWKPAVEVSLEGHISRDNGININHNMPVVDNYTGFSLIGQFGPAVKEVDDVEAQAVEAVRPGVYVYDMGQNMVGVPEIRLSGVAPGKKIILRYAEAKYPDLPEYHDHSGMMMLENIRAAMAQDIYITRGGEETIKPRFTSHGYRYVEITGIDSLLPLNAIKGTVLSSIDKITASYRTSNEKVNRLWENIKWSTLGNFLFIPTDCPQRNERLGWSGDISVFARTASYMGDLPQFFRRHMIAMRNTQSVDGRFSDVAPLGGGFGGVLWGSAGITVAWESYQQYGDKEMISEHYDAMASYIDYIVKKNIDPSTNVLAQEHPTFWGNLGDWLGPEQEKNDNTLLWEAYFIFDLGIMQKLAAALGKKDDESKFARLYAERKKFFNEKYIDNETRKTIHSGFRQHKTIDLKPGDLMDTQASYVLPLAFDIIQSDYKEDVVQNFVQTLTRERAGDDNKLYPPYSLMTGFIGTAWINKALSDNGHTEEAYRLLQQTSYPSWLYPVEQGATTIWERLNSFTHTNGFGGNNGMNSFNHYSFGAVGAWMYNYSLGIDRDENSPGFQHFNLHPEPDPTGQMLFAGGHYESMYGRIESAWEKSVDGFDYHFTVPSNTTATLYLISASSDNIFENGKLLKSSRGVKYLGSDGERQTFKLSAGHYNIQVRQGKK